MSHNERDTDRPTHSVEPKDPKDEKRGDHEVDAPKERTDDEIGSDGKILQRHE